MDVRRELMPTINRNKAAEEAKDGFDMAMEAASEAAAACVGPRPLSCPARGSLRAAARAPLLRESAALLGSRGQRERESQGDAAERQLLIRLQHTSHSHACCPSLTS